MQRWLYLLSSVPFIPLPLSSSRLGSFWHILGREGLSDAWKYRWQDYSWITWEEFNRALNLKETVCLSPSLQTWNTVGLSYVAHFHLTKSLWCSPFIPFCSSVPLNRGGIMLQIFHNNHLKHWSNLQPAPQKHWLKINITKLWQSGQMHGVLYCCPLQPHKCWGLSQQSVAERQEWTLDRSPVHHRTHTIHSPRKTLGVD